MMENRVKRAFADPHETGTTRPAGERSPRHGESSRPRTRSPAPAAGFRRTSAGRVIVRQAAMPVKRHDKGRGAGDLLHAAGRTPVLFRLTKIRPSSTLKSANTPITGISRTYQPVEKPGIGSLFETMRGKAREFRGGWRATGASHRRETRRVLRGPRFSTGCYPTTIDSPHGNHARVHVSGRAVDLKQWRWECPN